MRASLALTAMLFVHSFAAGERVPMHWLPGPLASDQYESSPTFTPDGQEIYFMRSDIRFQNYRLLWSRCEHGRWTPPQPPVFAAPAPILEGDPFVTPDGKRLYFISSRHAYENGRGNEDLDIWYVERGADGEWGKPVRLPAPVNSAQSELFPRTDDSGRLYFGSGRDGGMGKTDIYVATPGPDNSWQVENLGAPVNSAGEEWEAEISRDGRTLILVADRGGRAHLYRFALEKGRWIEKQRIPAYANVFQIGPLLSPKADRLLFAQADGRLSGEIFIYDLKDNADPNWPPACSRKPVASRDR